VVVGAETVAGLPASETWLVELLTDVGDGGDVPGTCLGIMGGSGGAGATVLAAAVAQTSARSLGTLLVDTDRLGPGADRVLGLEGEPGVRWDALARTSGRLSSRSLRESLPRAGRLSVLSWPADRTTPLDPVGVREALSAGSRGFAVTVVDLPRHLDPVVEETLARCDHVVLVVSPTVPGVASAVRLVRSLADGGPRRHMVVRGRPDGLDPDSVADLLGVPLLAAMEDQRRLEESIDLGVGPVRSSRGPLARVARRVVEALVPAGAS
jgi:secretion/DNA translocation related CpaE-like protein